MSKNRNLDKKEIENRLNEKSINKFNDNNNKDPYGYDFVPTIAHWTNVDEQRKEVERLENITKENRNNG